MVGMLPDDDADDDEKSWSRNCTSFVLYHMFADAVDQYILNEVNGTLATALTKTGNVVTDCRERVQKGLDGMPAKEASW